MLPVLLGSLYYGLLAVRPLRQRDHPGRAPGDAGEQRDPRRGAADGRRQPRRAREDTLFLRQFIHSLDLLKRLDQKLDLRRHYQQAVRDPLYKLPTDIDQERLLDYYRARVELSFDDLSSLLTVRVQGFDPVFAKRLNDAILAECDRFVNDFSQRVARDQMAFSSGELERASGVLQEAKGKLLAFQTRNQMLDPISQARAAGTLTAELQASLSRQEAELRNALTYLNADSYQVRALRSQVESTRQQIALERSRATSGRGGQQLNQLAADFHALTTQVGFAEDSYKLSLAAVENARIDTARKMKSLIVIEPPTQPETAIYPRPPLQPGDPAGDRDPAVRHRTAGDRDHPGAPRLKPLPEACAP